MRNHKHDGFTLIEILVVVGIIGIFAAALAPQLVGARRNAQNSAAQIYGHNVAVWIASAEADDETLLPGTLVGSCLSTELQTQGAPDTFPNSILDCEIAFEAGHYQVTVTSVSKKGGLANDGTFLTYY